jgi:16S rRNA (uracil1498-N3)-methyltransferase
MHRFFFFTQSLHIGQNVNLTPLVHQLHTVLRLQPGARIVLLDEHSEESIIEIQMLDRRQGIGVVVAQQKANGEPHAHITLFQCTLKADKFEWVLQKGTELGVACFAPVISERSVVRPATLLLKKYNRWQSILREAAEQSGRGCIPELLPPLDCEAALQVAVGIRLLPWENGSSGSGALKVASALDGFRRCTTGARPAISLLIGPEGGLTAAEVQSARAKGWQLLTLGPRILRAETAALAGVALIMNQLGEMQ